jgi:putative membrane protein
MLWIKALHIVFMVTWFAGLFYLPRLFVYHALAEDTASRERFKVMERKLYYGISGGWLHAKLALVAVLIGYHLWCGKLINDFKQDRNTRGHVWYRWFNEFPVVVLLLVVLLAVVKPF